MSGEQNPLQAFVSITSSTESIAQYWLEAGNFDLDVAVSLFFSTDKQDKITDVSSFRMNDKTTTSYDSSSSSKHSSKTRKVDVYDEDGIRKPDSVKKQKLLDDPTTESNIFPIMSHFQSGSSNNSLRRPIITAFASGSGSGSNSSQNLNDRDVTLARLFKPPHSMYVI